MDPALHELIESGPSNERVSALLRRRTQSVKLPSYIREVTRFGTISTIRIRRRDIKKAWSLKTVASLKAPRLLSLDERIQHQTQDRVTLTEYRRPPGLTSTGKGVVVGCLDWGLDFTHQAFRHADGTTRIAAIWDQRQSREDPKFPAPSPWGYGRLITRAQINKALKTKDPFKALNLKFNDKKRPEHGTHVMDIAAGTQRDNFQGGMAPDADLVFVQMVTGDRGPRADLGDTVQLPEAIDFIHRIAGKKPCVINMSLGSHSSSHDGTELVSMMNDNFLSAHNNRMIVQSAGNYYKKKAHTFTQLFAGRSETFMWQIDPRDTTMNELEFWYANTDKVVLEITPPNKRPITIPLGKTRVLFDSRGRRIMKAYHRAFDPNSPSHHIDVFVDPKYGAGEWKVKIRPIKILDGKIHGWIERDGTGFYQSKFAKEDVITTTTLGSICNGYLPLVVGASKGSNVNAEPASFTSSGPTRDNRQKPDIGAPGRGIIAARSKFVGGSKTAHNSAVRQSGSSMASPYVAGVVACCMEVASKPLTAFNIRKIVQYTSKKTSNSLRLGAGIVDPVKAETMTTRRY